MGRKPPVVAEEDNWPAGDGFPRMVRCHQCNHWINWRYVCEKGALEGGPVELDKPELGLECWWCYMQRKEGGITWGEVKKMFAKLYAPDRTHRVADWQNLLWYVTEPEADGVAKSAKETRQRNKRAYDAVQSGRSEKLSETSL